MSEHKQETFVTECEHCQFCDCADSLDMVCNFEPNFEVAPKKKCWRLSDFHDVKRKDDRVVCVDVDRFYTKGNKPKWCRLTKVSLTYK
jgi:hypothetical protein